MNQEQAKELAEILPKYQCHKKVVAVRILAVNPVFASAETPMILELEARQQDGRQLSVLMPRDWLDKHNPQRGDYLVIYGDGYVSVSPAKAFEEGYSRAGLLGPATPEPVTAPPGFSLQQYLQDAISTGVGICRLSAEDTGKGFVYMKLEHMPHGRAGKTFLVDGNEIKEPGEEYL